MSGETVRAGRAPAALRGELTAEPAGSAVLYEAAEIAACPLHSLAVSPARRFLTAFDLRRRAALRRCPGPVSTPLIGRRGTNDVLARLVPTSARVLGWDTDEDAAGRRAHVALRASLRDRGLVSNDPA